MGVEGGAIRIFRDRALCTLLLARQSVPRITHQVSHYAQGEWHPMVATGDSAYTLSG